MIGAVKVAGPGAPEGGGKDHHGQEKEDASDFQPENAAYAAKRAEKTSHSAGDSPCNLSGGLTCGAALGGGGRLARGGAGGGLRAGGHALAGDASGDAETDAQSTANGVRFHFVL